MRNGKSWSAAQDGRQEGDYATKEAAFEAIIGPGEQIDQGRI
jgi:hypothetical protein